MPDRRAGSRRLSHGFTLVEVLVALAILAIALASVMNIVAQSASTAETVRNRLEALWIAQDRITLYRLGNNQPSANTTTGKLTFGGREWHWRETVSASPVPNLRQIEVEVRLAEDREALSRLVGILE
ncbi:MAG: type II secretion system minor pseudopilin GspI [Gammaproteobacteria bacterium]|nr:type II secretion system minor pseudopilin GspI [Gammaproteobacteria bacterium]